MGEGTVAMSVSGRPVFVLQGAQPSHRDLGPGQPGPGRRPARAGPGTAGLFARELDGRYDGETAAAVAAWYESEGWEPFGATDIQLEALRAANAPPRRRATCTFRAGSQSRARQTGVTPGEIAQARIDLETARDGVDTAALGLSTARIRLRDARDVARRTTGIDACRAERATRQPARRGGRRTQAARR